MNFDTRTEFVRLSHNEPLTLLCSALADFLWEDFIRDSRPSIKYLIKAYNITQLSRFGKEIFERLYSGDQVKWLVSEDSYEKYFREVCNGNTAGAPEGYKSENGFWWAVMSDLTQTAGWTELLQRSVGQQFNAGNNAVNILNGLSDILEEIIEGHAVEVQTLINSGHKLEELREAYKKAVSAGDKRKAAAVRAEGIEINQRIIEAVQQAKELVQSSINEIVDEAVKKNDELNESINNLFGVQKGHGRNLGDLNEKRELANKLKNNRTLREITKKLGAIKRMWSDRKREKRLQSDYEAIVGARYSNDLVKAFPSEIALASTPQGRALFALKYSQKSLFTKDYTTKTKHIGKGPIIMYVDVSGSMSGDSEIWSKAVALVIAEQALLEKRRINVMLFDTEIQDDIELEASRRNNNDLLDFISTWHLGGGTSFNSVVSHAVNKGKISDRADVIMITDGHSEVSPENLRRLKTFKEQTGLQWTTICINSSIPEVCRAFSDEMFTVNTTDTVNTVNAIKKALR